VVRADGLARVLTGIRYTLEVKKMGYRRSCKHTISRTGDACQWSGQLQYGGDMGVIQGYRIEAVLLELLLLLDYRGLQSADKSSWS